MKTVELVPGLRSSVIGFGCASMMGAVGRETSIRALQLATDLGVNHFDTAPSYGYGESEKLLGEFVRSRREACVIATKYGIEISPAAVALRPLKSTVRAIRSIVQSRKTKHGSVTVAAGSGISAGLHRHVPITAQGLERSFHRSLHRLKTDYIDLLFLHDPVASISDPDELFLMVGKLKAAGKLRAFGLACMFPNLALHARDQDQFDLLQFNCPLSAESYIETKMARGHRANVLFSPFRRIQASGGEIVTRPSPSEALAILRHDFPSSVILCSMFTESHIRSNAAAGN